MNDASLVAFVKEKLPSITELHNGQGDVMRRLLYWNIEPCRHTDRRWKKLAVATVYFNCWYKRVRRSTTLHCFGSVQSSYYESY
jgi:hypothetical protein